MFPTIPSTPSSAFYEANNRNEKLEEMLEEVKDARNSVFVEGHRITMNIIPLFLCVFIPWGVYLLCCAVTMSSLHFFHQWLVFAFFGFVFVAWLMGVYLAVRQRFDNPNPTWMTYTVTMIGLAALAGLLVGQHLYTNYNEKYHSWNSLKYTRGLHTGMTHGSDVMDAGILEFVPGSMVDRRFSWHFKNGPLYCVAPVIFNNTAPATQYYDFWAVGKDCCSMGSSDFRCGAFDSVHAPKGLRVMDDAEIPYYRLAVQAASALYHINAKTPIFFEWSEDPARIVRVWSELGLRIYVESAIFALVVSLFCTALAAMRFAFLGRRNNHMLNERTVMAWQSSPLMYAGCHDNYRAMNQGRMPGYFGR